MPLSQHERWQLVAADRQGVLATINRDGSHNDPRPTKVAVGGRGGSAQSTITRGGATLDKATCRVGSAIWLELIR